MSIERRRDAVQPGTDGTGVEFVQTGGVRPRRAQRSEARLVSVFRLAKRVGAGEALCPIRDISADGLKLEVFSPKAVGEDVAVDFGDGVGLPVSLPYRQLAGWIASVPRPATAGADA